MTPALVRMWGQIIVGVLVVAMFLAVLVVVYILRNAELISAMVGYVAGFASAVVNYYYGSSASSQEKNEKLVAPPHTPTP